MREKEETPETGTTRETKKLQKKRRSIIMARLTKLGEAVMHAYILYFYLVQKSFFELLDAVKLEDILTQMHCLL